MTSVPLTYSGTDLEVGLSGAPPPPAIPPPPPASVANSVPAFHTYGKHKCGNHNSDEHRCDIPDYPDNIRRRAIRRQLDRQQDNQLEAIACVNCRANIPLGGLHNLPCGHFLCRSCLLMKVILIKAKTETNRQKIRDTRNKMLEAERRYYHGANSTMNPRRRSNLKLLLRRVTTLGNRIIELAGFMCCRKNMQLHRFLACLSPDLARETWLIMHWVWNKPRYQRVCAWPDCGAYLPLCCSYRKKGADDSDRWYCVVCGGHSMSCGRVLEGAQTRFPWLPRGQYALTPCSEGIS